MPDKENPSLVGQKWMQAEEDSLKPIESHFWAMTVQLDTFHPDRI